MKPKVGELPNRRGCHMIQEQWRIQTPEHVGVQYKLAGLGSRGAALMVDMLLITLLQIGLAALYLFTDKTLPDMLLDRSNFFYAMVILAIFIINWGYFYLFELLAGGKTIGKMLLHIRVVDEKGGSPTGLAILIRNLVRIIDMLPFYYLLGMVMVFVHPQHKRLGDLVGGTIVVHERQKKKKSKKYKKTWFTEVVESRGLTPLPADEVSFRHFSKREWDLLKTYMERFPTLSEQDHLYVTREVASILLPALKIEYADKSILEHENMILRIYLTVREEWEYQWNQPDLSS